MLRGSAVTGRRWNDGAPFDSDGPGTSDLDLTLVGADAIGLFSLTGFFVPGIHSRPLSDEDPDIAPSLVPLRAELMAMVGRPVNIQASRDIVIVFRGDLLDQPYLTLLEKPDTLTLLDRRGRDVTLRLLSYNIRHGGVGRVEAIAAVIRGCAPDVVVLQEATRPDVVRALAGETGLPQHGSHRGQSLGFLSRIGIAKSVWRRPLLSRHAFLDLTLEGHDVHIVGVHLSAVHAAWTERRRLIELASLLRAVKARQHGFHVLAGDFNTLAPGESLDVQRLPARLRPLVWLSGGSIRWKTIAAVLAAGYADVWRGLHPEGDGADVPDLGPASPAGLRVRAGRGRGARGRLRGRHGPDTIRASDHHPLVAEIELPTAAAAG